ncbi:MAG: hypothetical protein IMF19_12820 [Proteobacteria bacterium]|nr:hypothetical protein [Pseudomonadota bacterium]
MEKSEGWKFVTGSSILIIGLAVAYLIARDYWNTPAGLGVVGIVIFIATLIGLNYLSEEHELTTGEVRKSIAIASTVVFFGLFFICPYTQELKPLIDNFWKVYGVIIGFYFGSRAAEEINKLRAKKREEEKKSEKSDVEKIKAIHTRIDAVEKEIVSLGSETKTGIVSLRNEMLTKFEAADAKVESLRKETETEIASLRNEMLTKFKEVDNKIASVDANVTGLRKGVESLETLENGAKAVKGIVEAARETKAMLEKMVVKKHKKDDETSQQG